MDDASRIATAKQYLRRKYANDLNGLKKLAEEIATSGFDAVTITGQSFEGGNHTGQLVFEPMAYLTAVEDLISELDPDNTPAAPSPVTHADFSGSQVET